MTDDAILQTLRELRGFDVSTVRAQRLGKRCRRLLAVQKGMEPARRADRRARLTLCVLAGAWCGVYLFETIRRAAAVYGF